MVAASEKRPALRLLTGIAALAFVAAAVVSAATIADYWSHPHFIKVRSMTFDFWQNLQFVIPLAGLAVSTVVALARPAWLQGRGPLIVMAIAAVVLASTPWWRLLHEHSILYPPAHYLAREAAGLLLAAMIACMWLHAAWQRRPPRILVTLRLPAVSRRLVAAMTVLVIAAAIPDVVLTGLWSDYLGRMRDLVDSRQGIIRAERAAHPRLARQAVRPGLVATRHERDREPHARPSVPAGRQRLPEQPAVRSGLRDPAAPEGLWLGEIVRKRGPRGPLISLAGSAPLTRNQRDPSGARLAGLP